DLKRLFHISGNSLTNSFEEARNMFYPIFSDEKSFEITVDSYQFRCYCDSSGVVSVPTGFNSDNKADRIIINFGRGACDFFRLVAV
ncbi:hypothetical protein RYX36_020808, partial [Vicia faba]